MANKATAAAVVISAVSLCTSAVSVGFALKNKPADSKPETSVTSSVTAETTDDDKTMQYVMYVGTNDKDTYKPEHTQEEARNIVDEVCMKYFDGYTMQDATGSWVDETGTAIHQYTIVCYFDGADKETVYKAADDLMAALNQSAVLIEETAIKMDYYMGS